jgi:hypothetical protein
MFKFYRYFSRKAQKKTTLSKRIGANSVNEVGVAERLEQSNKPLSM